MVRLDLRGFKWSTLIVWWLFGILVMSSILISIFFFSILTIIAIPLVLGILGDLIYGSRKRE